MDGRGKRAQIIKNAFIVCITAIRTGHSEGPSILSHNKLGGHFKTCNVMRMHSETKVVLGYCGVANVISLNPTSKGSPFSRTS